MGFLKQLSQKSEYLSFL